MKKVGLFLYKAFMMLCVLAIYMSVSDSATYIKSFVLLAFAIFTLILCGQED